MLNWLQRLFKKPQQRSFHAAIASRLTGDWSTAPFPINYDIRNGYTALIARVRDLARNNDYVKRYLALTRNNVVGPRGIVIQSRVPSNTQDGEIDTLASQSVEAAWAGWSKYGIPDVTGKQSWLSLQNTFITDVMRDGEALYRHVRGWDNGYGYALQRLDVVNLPIEPEDQYQGRPVVMGIELDEFERPIAYHMRQHTPGQDTYYRNGNNYLRISADEILHCFLPEFAHQTRGFSPMSSAMLRLKMLGGYEEAAVTSARVSASTMGFFTRSQDGLGYEKEGTYPDGSLDMGVEPGVLKELPAGVDFSAFDPSQPNDNYQEFVKATLRGIASGLGVSYNTLANDLEGVNFSSIRAGVLEDREAWKALQQWMIDCFVRPVREAWIPMAILAGGLTIGGRPPSSSPERYMPATYQGRRWSWVDPKKDAETAQLLINERLMSRSMVIQEMGNDPDDVWMQIQAEDEKLESMGIAPLEAENETQGQADPEL